MKTFIVTYDHSVYKPSTFEQLKEQQKFKVEVTAEDLPGAKETFKKDHNKLPMYFQFTPKV